MKRKKEKSFEEELREIGFLGMHIKRVKEEASKDMSELREYRGWTYIVPHEEILQLLHQLRTPNDFPYAVSDTNQKGGLKLEKVVDYCDSGESIWESIESYIALQFELPDKQKMYFSLHYTNWDRWMDARLDLDEKKYRWKVSRKVKGERETKVGKVLDLDKIEAGLIIEPL